MLTTCKNGYKIQLFLFVSHDFFFIFGVILLYKNLDYLKK